MRITEVRIFQKENIDKKLRAFVTITLDDCFVVRDIKIIERPRGLFVAMPSRWEGIRTGGGDAAPKGAIEEIERSCPLTISTHQGHRCRRALKNSK